MVRCEGPEGWSNYPSLDEGLTDLRQNWNDKGGPLAFWFTDEDGRLLAVVFRPRTRTDPELATTRYADGREETHRISGRNVTLL